MASVATEFTTTSNITRIKCDRKRRCKDALCINARTCLYMDLNKKRKGKRQEIAKVSKRVQALISAGHEPWCACCYATEPLTFDHIIPLSRGGEDRNDNGQILCHSCNNIKGSLLVELEELRNIVKQKKQAWSLVN